MAMDWECIILCPKWPQQLILTSKCSGQYSSSLPGAHPHFGLGTRRATASTGTSECCNCYNILYRNVVIIITLHIYIYIFHKINSGNDSNVAFLLTVQHWCLHILVEVHLYCNILNGLFRFRSASVLSRTSNPTWHWRLYRRPLR